ncbi:MAG: hypothetical protein U9R50_07300 [Campylobacterota bacterium]|nr:hypothetical protein [Campylobacterota bacterium]
MTSIECIQQCSIDAKTLLIGLSIIISAGVSIFFYIKNRAFGFENSIHDRLFKIQDIAFNNPFLENKQFISGWDDFSRKYRNNSKVDFNDENVKKYLQYEQYCEMIFNLISDTYVYTKDERKLLKLIDHKEWTRTHKNWWKNPLEEHSNHDCYDKELTDIIDNWIK